MAWQAIFAPAGTPKPTVNQLHAEIGKILREPDSQERLAKLGVDGADLTIDQFAAFQKAEVTKWAAVIKAANTKLECVAVGRAKTRLSRPRVGRRRALPGR